MALELLDPIPAEGVFYVCDPKYLSTTCVQKRLTKDAHMFDALFTFLIPHRNDANLSYRLQKQLPYIALSTLFMLLTFSLLLPVGLISSGGKFNWFLGIILLLSVSLAFALLLLRNKKYLVAARLASVILFLSSMATLYLMPYTGVPTEAYRAFAFMTVMATCNVLLSLELKQIVLFYAGLVTGWIIAFNTIFTGLWTVNRRLTLAIFLVGILGVSISNLVLVFVKKLSDELLETARRETETARTAFANLTKILEDARDGMAIGERILSASSRVQTSLGEMEQLQNYLSEGSRKLVAESDGFTESSKEVLANTRQMKDNLQEQNSSLTETSAAITEISANLENISGIAVKRRQMLGDISKSGEAQKDLVKKLLVAVDTVQKSSEGIIVFVHTVQDVASRTGLLSMNASIEAARAGSYGKGFAVIAQEIRALSEETQSNAGTIKTLLDENTHTVRATNAMMQDFSVFVEKSVNDTGALIDAIDEILRGISEMDTGTREVMQAAQDIVSAAQESGEMVNAVVSQIGRQKESFDHIAGFSAELHNRIILLERSVKEIREASDLVADAGRLNTEQVKKLQTNV